MRVLLLLKHPIYLRNQESVVRLLCQRGHEVHVGLDKPQKGRRDQSELLRALDRQLPSFSWGMTPQRPRDEERRFAQELRLATDYLRFLHTAYDDATTLRERARRKAAPAWLLDELEQAGDAVATRDSLMTLLNAVERAIAPHAQIVEFITDQRPAIVAVSPFVDFGTPQVDHVRAAMSLGLPTALLVKSWDNLSSKGLVRETPDMVAVWNDAQRREAVELHGVPAERVVVTGAQPWDQWFEREPSRTREELARDVGLPEGRRYILYLATSAAIGEEAPFVAEWARAVRSSRVLKGLSILVRPHPQVDATQWEGLRLKRLVVHPPRGAEPVEEDTKADFFDAMHHAAAVVGINTSAMIESAIAGHQAFSVADPRFAAWQDGTLHFRYLRDDHGGLVTVAQDLAEHVSQLEATIGSGQRAPVNAQALRALVRPHGLDQPATRLLVDALERAAATGPRNGHEPGAEGIRLRPVAEELISRDRS